MHFWSALPNDNTFWELKFLGHPRIIDGSKILAVEHENRSAIELAQLISNQTWQSLLSSKP